jgi:hypothetical protein
MNESQPQHYALPFAFPLSLLMVRLLRLSRFFPTNFPQVAKLSYVALSVQSKLLLLAASFSICPHGLYIVPVN